MGKDAFEFHQNNCTSYNIGYTSCEACQCEKKVHAESSSGSVKYGAVKWF